MQFIEAAAAAVGDSRILTVSSQVFSRNVLVEEEAYYFEACLGPLFFENSQVSKYRRASDAPQRILKEHFY